MRMRSREPVRRAYLDWRRTNGYNLKPGTAADRVAWHTFRAGFVAGKLQQRLEGP